MREIFEDTIEEKGVTYFKILLRRKEEPILRYYLSNRLKKARII
jgi:hypothetical protein